MYLDLHTHSVSSDDSRATVDQFVQWIGYLRGKGYRVDGFVLTEHRKLDLDRDYSGLARKGQVVILKGSELDTDLGHFLVYGANEDLARNIDFARVGVDAAELVAAAEEAGAIATPAHPGRFGTGLYEYIANGADLLDVRVVERLNGGNRPGEDTRTEELVGRYGFRGTGGSDAHLVSAIGSCLTRFDNPVADESDLVRELKAGRFDAVRMRDTAAG